MNGSERLHAFRYRYLDGPLSLDGLQAGPTEGNCRLAVQSYFYTLHGLYLDREEIVLPEAYRNKGIFVKDFQGDTAEFFSSLQEGDIVYAEKLRDSVGRKLRSGKERFSTEDEWLMSLHMGVFLITPTDDILSRFSTYDEIDGEKPSIWHASFIAGGTALWSIDKFCYYYQPVTSKRILI